MTRTAANISTDLRNFGKVTEDKVEKFDDLVAEAVENADESLILPLMLALDDLCEFDEVMFGVVHALEKLHLDTYLLSLAKNIAQIWLKSPRWCMILHKRIINSPPAFSKFLKAFPSSSVCDNCRATEKIILHEISMKEVFRDRCLAGISELDSM